MTSSSLRLPSLEEAAERFGLTAEDLRRHLDETSLVEVTKPGQPTRTHVPEYALQAAGLTSTDTTETDRRLQRLLAYIAHSHGGVFTNADAARASNLAEQTVKVALATLAAVGLVRKTSEPPPTGRGGRQTIWRAVDQS